MGDTEEEPEMQRSSSIIAVQAALRMKTPNPTGDAKQQRDAKKAEDAARIKEENRLMRNKLQNTKATIDVDIDNDVIEMDGTKTTVGEVRKLRKMKSSSMLLNKSEDDLAFSVHLSRHLHEIEREPSSLDDHNESYEEGMKRKAAERQATREAQLARIQTENKAKRDKVQAASAKVKATNAELAQLKAQLPAAQPDGSAVSEEPHQLQQRQQRDKQIEELEAKLKQEQQAAAQNHEELQELQVLEDTFTHADDEVLDSMAGVNMSDMTPKQMQQKVEQEKKATISRRKARTQVGGVTTAAQQSKIDQENEAMRARIENQRTTIDHDLYDDMFQVNGTGMNVQQIREVKIQKKKAVRDAELDRIKKENKLLKNRIKNARENKDSAEFELAELRAGLAKVADDNITYVKVDEAKVVLEKAVAAGNLDAIAQANTKLADAQEVHKKQQDQNAIERKVLDQQLHEKEHEIQSLEAKIEEEQQHLVEGKAEIRALQALEVKVVAGEPEVIEQLVTNAGGYDLPPIDDPILMATIDDKINFDGDFTIAEESTTEAAVVEKADTAPLVAAKAPLSWQQKIAAAEDEKKDEAALCITAALRARRFRKLLNNDDLIASDPGLKALRTCIVRRCAGSGHRDMEKVIDSTMGWYRGVFHNDEGVTLSLKARRAKKLDSREFTYGEVNFHTWIEVLRRANPKRGEKFVDLGSGLGKAVFAAHLFFPFGMSVGIEFLEDLHRSAEQALQKFDSQIRTLLDESKRSQRISFENKNLLHAQWKDADVVFFSASSFSDATIESVSAKCAQLKPGARIITIVRRLVDPDELLFKEIDRVHCQMSFGPSTAIVYERKDPRQLEKDRESRRVHAEADMFNFKSLDGLEPQGH